MSASTELRILNLLWFGAASVITAAWTLILNAVFFTLTTLYLYPEDGPITDPTQLMVHKTVYYGGLIVATLVLLLVFVKAFKSSIRGSRFVLTLQTVFSLVSGYVLLQPHHNPAKEEVNMSDLVAGQFGDPISFISRIVLLLSLGLIFVIRVSNWIQKPKKE